MNAEQRIDRLEVMFAEFSKNAVTREEFNARMTAVEGRMTALETRMTALETRMTSFESRMVSLEARMTAMEDRLFRWAIALMSVQVAIAGLIWFR